MRLRARPLAACASLFIFPFIIGTSIDANAADVGSNDVVEEAAYDVLDDQGPPGSPDIPDTYDYGDADYVAPSPIYYAVRGAITASEFSGDDIGVHGALAAGVDLEQMYDVPLTRLEIELGHLSNGTADGDRPDGEREGIAGFVSLYRDLAEFHNFRPYVGAGIGLAHIAIDVPDQIDDADTGFAWHVTTGISMDWSERTTVDLGYRYTSVHDIEVTTISGGTTRFDPHTHGVFAGLRFRL